MKRMNVLRFNSEFHCPYPRIDFVWSEFDDKIYIEGSNGFKTWITLSDLESVVATVQGAKE